MTSMNQRIKYILYSFSHGTSVAGIIGATKGNNYCAVGVAYNVTLIGKQT